MAEGTVVERAPRYPVTLAVAGRRCVVVGGGRVATRKVTALLEAGAAVHVVSPALSDAIEALAAAGRITVERRGYQPGDLRGAFLAIAATDARAVNAAVAAEARAERVLVTVCDDPAASDVGGAAVIRRGALTVAVSTEGESPALAQLVREELAAFLTPEYATLLELAAAERRAAQQRALDLPPARWRAALTPAVLALVRAGDLPAARAQLRAALGIEPALAGQVADSEGR
jgi:precorrin-2 dehydrogenase/sirohydrochlorin ferrochelatase